MRSFAANRVVNITDDRFPKNISLRIDYSYNDRLSIRDLELRDSRRGYNVRASISSYDVIQADFAGFCAMLLKSDDLDSLKGFYQSLNPEGYVTILDQANDYCVDCRRIKDV